MGKNVEIQINTVQGPYIFFILLTMLKKKNSHDVKETIPFDS